MNSNITEWMVAIVFISLASLACIAGIINSTEIHALQDSYVTITGKIDIASSTIATKLSKPTGGCDMVSLGNTISFKQGSTTLPFDAQQLFIVCHKSPLEK